MDWTLAVDGLIILAYFTGILLIGIYVGRRDDSLEDYALGGRKIPWWAVMASIIAAETSAATFLGAPNEGFSSRGLMYVQLTMGLILGRILVGVLFLKPYYVYKVYTVYDFLLIRFGPWSKYSVSLIFLFFRTIASGVRLFIASLVMVLAWKMIVQGQEVEYQALTSWQPYAVAIIVLTILTCIYTVLGGIKAVIWTDVIQACLMFSTAVIAIVTIVWHIGEYSFTGMAGDVPVFVPYDGNFFAQFFNGFTVLAQRVPEITTLEGYFRTGFEEIDGTTWGEIGIWNTIKLILVNPYTIPAALLATTFGNMAAFGTDQDMVQRMLTAESYKKARRSLITAALMDVPIAAVFTFIGVLLIVFYEQNPDKMPELTNNVFGAYIMSTLPVVIRGLVLAGVFATAMGSFSAALNALATTATNDWYIPLFARNASPRHQVTAARVWTTVFAVAMVLIAIFFAVLNVADPAMRIIPVALTIANYFLSPMLGLFLLGMLTKRRGADKWNFVALILGIIIVTMSGGNHVGIGNWLNIPDLLAGWGLIEPGQRFSLPAWLLAPGATGPDKSAISWTWAPIIGAAATFFIGLLLPTPREKVESAERLRVEGVKAETERTGFAH